MSSGPSTPTNIPVRMRGVSKRFGSTLAVCELDLEVNRAEVLALLGPNGAGKTTTVEMCEGFLRPDAGTIEVLGLDPCSDNAQVRGRIGVMLQGGGGYPSARAGEMLNLVAAYSARPLDPAWLLDTLGLTDAARTTYRRLSGGQQQRLALACAIVGRPELVFLDEPTAGMDAHARLVVWELIDALRRDGVTVVLTTHQLKEAEELSDRIVIIDRGSAVVSGTPAQLMNSGAEDQLRFTAPRRLDMSLLIAALPEGYRAEGLRGAFMLLRAAEQAMAAYGAQVRHWDRTTRFCGECGGATVASVDPARRAKRCPGCGHEWFPRVSPCVITLVYDGAGRVLLTRQASWPAGRYGLVAGFVEPGETLEDCVRREAYEETGVTLADVAYAGSQPWPFPHQLMVGFTARHVSGDPSPRDGELEDARWFAPDALPVLPPRFSIARRMLDAFFAR